MSIYWTQSSAPLQWDYQRPFDLLEDLRFVAKRCNGPMFLQIQKLGQLVSECAAAVSPENPLADLA